MAPYTESIPVKYFFPAGFAFTSVGVICASNYYNRRPLWAGVQRHIFFGIAGGLVGYYFEIFLKRRNMRRDAMIRHYIELHPEDFEVKKRKYKEVFDEWIPFR